MVAPDYEANGSAAGNNAYVVDVNASDGTVAVTQTITVTVTDVNEIPVITSVATNSVSENQTYAIDVNATDDDGDALTYTISGGDDQSKFDLNSSTGVLTFKVAPDYEANGSAAGNNAYVVDVNASDGTVAVTQTITVTVTDVNEIPVITSVATNSVSENQTYAIDVNATDDDGDTLSYTISGGADQLKFDLNSTTGVLTFKSAPDYEANGSAAGNNAYVVDVNASDGTVAVTQTITVTVTDVNEAPVITQGAGPLSVTMSEDGSPTAWVAPTLGATDAETADSALVWSVSSAASNGTPDRDWYRRGSHDLHLSS